MKAVHASDYWRRTLCSVKGSWQAEGDMLFASRLNEVTCKRCRKMIQRRWRA